MAVLRHYLKNTQANPGAGGTTYDLSVTQGTSATLTSAGVSGTSFVPVFEWTVTLGTDVPAASVPVSVNISAVSASTLEARWRVEHRSSSGSLIAASGYSAAYNSTGTKADSLTLDTTWAAGDRLVLVMELRRTGGGGSRTVTISVNNAASYADPDLQAPPTLEAVGNDLAQSYGIASQVGAGLSGAYALAAHVGAQVPGGYAVQAHVAADQSASYTVLTAVGREQVCTHVVVAGVGQDLSGGYGVGGAVGADWVGAYSLAGAVASELQAAHAVLANVQASVPGAYAIRAAAAQSIDGGYGVLAFVWNQHAGVYPVSGAVHAELSSAYGVAAAVGSSLQQAHAVFVAVPAFAAGGWVVLQSAGEQLPGGYEVQGTQTRRAPVGQGYSRAPVGLRPLTRTQIRPAQMPSNRSASANTKRPSRP